MPMTPEVVRVFNEPKAVKVLATVDAEGKLNNVPIGSLIAIDNDHLAFADMFMAKTKVNLKATKKACAVAFTVPTAPGVMPTGFQVKGTFEGFQTSGPIYEAVRAKVAEMMGGAGIRGVGIIKAEEGWNVTPGTGAYQVFQKEIVSGVVG